MFRVTAIIPTLSNTSGLLGLVAALEEAGVPVVVVDNGPNEEKQVLKGRKGVVYLPQTENRGFAGAVNLGARQATGDGQQATSDHVNHAEHDNVASWLLIANDDVSFPTGGGKSYEVRGKINALIGKAEKEGWSAVSPVLRSPAGKIENIGYRVLPIGRVELNFDPNDNSDRDLDGLTAACLLVKREAFENLGGFDESFIAYLEDVDFFLRFKRAGYKFGVATDVEVLHKHLSTSKKMKGFKQKRDLINWIKVIQKHWKVKTLVQYAPGIIVERLRNLSGFLKARIR